MKIKDRENLIKEIASMIVSNTPVREVLRVYSQALDHELNSLSDEDLIEQLKQAGYTEFVNQFVEN